MRVLIVGAGVVGITTAYFVAKRGHEVTLLERDGTVASGTSLANAGQLSYSYTDTLASPGLLSKLPAIILGRDRGMHVRFDAALLSWGPRFLLHCNRRDADANTVKLLHLAHQSQRAMQELLADMPLQYAPRVAGKLLVTSSAQVFAQLVRRSELKRRHGAKVEIVSYGDCCRIEPALANWRSRIVGGAFAPDDAVGDSHLFSRELCTQLVSRSMSTVLISTRVIRLMQHRDRVVGVHTSAGELEADAVVMCTGANANQLLRQVSSAVPIYPLKGYSITTASGPDAPQVSVTDLDRRIVFANLQGRVRLAGLADCFGSDSSIDEQRVQDLVALGRAVLPGAADFDGALNPWAGLRPATPSGLPIVGPTRTRGLFVNLGHGGLGWTLACATAQQLAREL
jgi:D-amino-acid dehydrogenase